MLALTNAVVLVDATLVSFPAANHATVALALADLDGDGEPDLGFGNHGERSRLYLNDGGGRFRDATAGRLPADTRGATAVEPVGVDEDGDLDLILATWAGPVLLFRNDGTGSFTDTSATQLRASPADGDIVVGDVDGDGDSDFIATTIGQAHRYTNLLVQLDAPLVRRVGADYRIDVHARHGHPSAVDVALPFLAATRAITPLPPLGVLGLDPATILALPPLLIPRPLGTGSLVVRVPSDPALRGRAIHAQALLLRYPIDARLTGVITDVALR